MHEPAPADPYREQKRVFSPLELELHTTVGVQHGCWETSSGPLQEQEVPVLHVCDFRIDLFTSSILKTLQYYAPLSYVCDVGTTPKLPASSLPLRLYMNR